MPPRAELETAQMDRRDSGEDIASMTNNNGSAAGPKPFHIPSFPTHPGGQATLQTAKTHPNRDIMFLKSHVGLDLEGRIAEAAKARGVTLPMHIAGPMFHEIHQAARQIIQERPGQVHIYHIFCLILTVLLPTSIVGFICTGSPWYAALLAVSFVSYSFNVFHMRHHRGGKVFDRPWLDNFLSPFYSFIDHTFMVYPAAWLRNHNASHHMSTNDAALDMDVTYLFKAGVRLHESLPYKPKNKYQAFYCPLLFIGKGISFPWDNVFRHGGNPVYLVVYYFLLFALPMYFHGWAAFRIMLVTLGSIGITISYLFQVSHNHVSLGFGANKTSEPVKNRKKTGYKMDEWMCLQFEEAISWGGWGACLIFGGINYQIEHHVAPSLPSPLFYHYLAPKLRSMAERYDVKYTRVETFFDALVAYNDYVCYLSHPPKNYKKQA